MDTVLLGYQRAFPATPFAVGCLLDVRGSVPDIEALCELVADRARTCLPLTQRVLSPRRRRPCWVVDDAFDAARHIHACRLSAGSDTAELRVAVQRLSASGFPADRPPWQLWLLHGHRPDGFSLLFRSSHVWMDGLGQNLLLERLFGHPGPGSTHAPLRSASVRRSDPRALGRATAHMLSWCTRTATIGPFEQVLVGHPQHTWLEVDLARLRAISRAFQVPVNDIFLAAVTGILRAWSGSNTEHAGRRRELVHAAMPVSTRRTTEQIRVGNHLTSVRIALPYGEASVRRRVEAIHRQTSRHKRVGTPGVAERLFLWTVPAPLRPSVMAAGMMSRVFALTASNPHGLTGPLHVLGRPVTAAVPIPPLPGSQRMAVMLGGLDGQAAIGFTLDGSVQGGSYLPALLEAELHALEVEGGLLPGQAPLEWTPSPTADLAGADR
ncbi:wax ester/triacylglycerol synthase domain-containing protein [Frankia sp. R82]|uniref:wax ester/triacylglycerol synthase domain-containing protein n=1 Tax=Frankia sp. R82 TaxID=2950553 RepID=UPI0020435C85|nr:wax ester/triacylglycerol synthase domain-containing protein [Frankia sp. R82]MCM3887375.1 WS/DGAT domain-containing protein [Frankia sp. R82]